MSAKKLTLVAVSLLAVTSAIILDLACAPLLHAQSATSDWEKAAGGKMSFEVASVKRNNSGYPPVGPPPHSNFPFPGDAYSSNGGLFSATNWPAYVYISFAYKLTSDELISLKKQLPEWASAEHFDIEARAKGNPTKDQMRLMMQALLADRFKLAVHFESRQGPVYALVVARAGKLGPQITPHSDSLPCVVHTSGAPDGSTAPRSGEALPFRGLLTARLDSGHMDVSTRGISMDQIADYVAGVGGLGRPMVDRTGLSGHFDFEIEFAGGPGIGPPGGLSARQPNFQADPNAPTFLEALRDQLGLKFESTTGFVDVLVVDHIEEPAPN